MTSLAQAFHLAIMEPTSCRTVSGWSASKGCDVMSSLTTSAVTSHVAAEVLLSRDDAICDKQSTPAVPVSLAACYVVYNTCGYSGTDLTNFIGF